VWWRWHWMCCNGPILHNAASPFHRGIRTRLIHCAFWSQESSPWTGPWSIQPFLHSGAMWQTDTPCNQIVTCNGLHMCSCAFLIAMHILCNSTWLYHIYMTYGVDSVRWISRDNENTVDLQFVVLRIYSVNLTRQPIGCNAQLAF